jgi:hypothetical protein
LIAFMKGVMWTSWKRRAWYILCIPLDIFDFRRELCRRHFQQIISCFSQIKITIGHGESIPWNTQGECCCKLTVCPHWAIGLSRLYSPLYRLTFSERFTSQHQLSIHRIYLWYCG